MSAAMTVMQASRIMDNSSPLIIFDGNHRICWDAHCTGLREMLTQIQDADATVAVFHDYDLRWSYVQLMPGSRTQVVAVKRKVAMSNTACTGLFCFRRGSDFVHAANVLKSAGEHKKDHIAAVLDSMIANDKRVDAVIVAGSNSIREVVEVKQFTESVFAQVGLVEQMAIYSEMRDRNQSKLNEGFSYDTALAGVDDRRCIAMYVMADARNFFRSSALDNLFSKMQENLVHMLCIRNWTGMVSRRIHYMAAFTGLSCNLLVSTCTTKWSFRLLTWMLSKP